MRSKLWRWLVPKRWRRRVFRDIHFTYEPDVMMKILHYRESDGKKITIDLSQNHKLRFVNCTFTPHERDAAALRSDWNAVGRDLWSAIDEYGETQGDEGGDDTP